MMVLPPKVDHPKGDRKPVQKPSAFCADMVDTYDGKIHSEWDPDAAITPMGLLPFFLCDGVNPALLGMNKIVSEDSAQRAIKKIEQQAGIDYFERKKASVTAENALPSTA